MADLQKPRIAIFSGATATIQNSPPLITSNKARAEHGLRLISDAEGRPVPFDGLRPQRLAAPVTVYIEQFSAHPLERDAAELYGPPDGYVDAKGEFHDVRQGPGDKPVYRATLLPEDGLYLLPYMAVQADGKPWDDYGRLHGSAEGMRQSFYPDGSRLFEEIDRFGLDVHGFNNQLASHASFDFYRVVPPGGYTKGLRGDLRTDIDDGDIAPEVMGEDFFPYQPVRTDPPKTVLARVANTVQSALDTGKYTGAIWLEGSPNVEESVYLLNLFIDTSLPVCGISSQRPHLALANDGDRNIVDSVDYIRSRIWADEQGRDCIGVVAVLDQQVFTARDVQKGDARPGGYLATGGHGGVVGRLGSSAEEAALTFRPVKAHTYKSAVNLRRLSAGVTGVRRVEGKLATVPVAVKDDQGWLLASAIPEVRFVKSARYLARESSFAPDSEVEVLSRIEQNLKDAPLAGFVAEGRVGGGMTHSLDAALELAVYHGMPVVKVNRGDVHGMVLPRGDSLFIAGNNLTANKARWLLLACLLKLGSLPPAADPRNPTAAEKQAIKERVREFQAIFNTH